MPAPAAEVLAAGEALAAMAVGLAAVAKAAVAAALVVSGPAASLFLTASPRCTGPRRAASSRRVTAERAVWDRTQPHDRRERLFGGSGAVLVWSLCADDPRPPFAAILACELEGNGSVGTHVQQEFAEVVIVLEGQGTARVAGAPVPLHPGVVLQLPLGDTLALQNGAPDRPLRYLIIKAG
jgi:mannose-6-phosphate isomerase-like protein (cupin superfamily)